MNRTCLISLTRYLIHFGDNKFKYFNFHIKFNRGAMYRHSFFKLIVEKFFLKYWKQKPYNLKRQIGHRPKSTEVI